VIAMRYDIIGVVISVLIVLILVFVLLRLA
jgi:hypothetical protein